jgi:hypothetical protein
VTPLFVAIHAMAIDVEAAADSIKYIKGDNQGYCAGWNVIMNPLLILIKINFSS